MDDAVWRMWDRVVRHGHRGAVMQCQPPVREWLAARAREIGPHGFLVEVGTWQGDTARILAAAGAIVLCVDRFDGRAMGTPGVTFPTWVANVAGAGRIVGVVGDSWDVPALFLAQGFADLVFIDADHSHAAVIRDIKAWAPVVKAGGWLCGDDWNEESVRAAVLDMKIKPEVIGGYGWATQVQR